MSLNLLLRGPSVFKNIALDTMRKRKALSFRKTLGVYNYKVKPANYYKNPHQVELRKKETLLKAGDTGMRKLHAIQRMSNTPFGKLTSKGKFIKDFQRMPIYNIPDLTDFQLKPYMTFMTEKLSEENTQQYESMNKQFLLDNIKTQLSLSNDPDVKKLAQEIFETQQGQQIVEEYLEKHKKLRKLKIANF